MRPQPRDVPDQAWFLNQVVEIETSLLPMQLLGRTQKIERALGRIPTRPKGPRVIDLDILFYADTVVATPGLEIPHPRLRGPALRAGAIGGACSGAAASPDRHTVREMLAQVGNQRVQRI